MYITPRKAAVYFDETWGQNVLNNISNSMKDIFCGVEHRTFHIIVSLKRIRISFYVSEWISQINKFVINSLSFLQCWIVRHRYAEVNGLNSKMIYFRAVVIWAMVSILFLRAPSSLTKWIWSWNSFWTLKMFSEIFILAYNSFIS